MAEPRQPRLERPMWLAATVAALAVAGAVAGGVLGMQSATEYEINASAQIDHVLGFPPWEANQETARFAHTLRRDDIRQGAVDASGLPSTAFGQISAISENDAPLVDVMLVVTDGAQGTRAIEQLIDAALLEMVASDRVPEQIVVDANADALADVEAELESIYADTGTAPGTNLADRYNRAILDLQLAQAELAVATEQFRIDRLPAEIEVRQELVDTLEPVVGRWGDARDLHNMLETRIAPAVDRLQQLDLGLEVLERGSHVSDVTSAEVPRRTTVGRHAAGGAAVGVAVGVAVALMILAAATLRRSRRDV